MARRKKATGPKEKKRKRVTKQLLEREHAGKVTKPYQILDDLVATVHGHLRDLEIGIAWRLGWRPDADEHLQLGQLNKRNDLDRELDRYDFVVLLNKEAWSTLKEPQQKALIDHELCHAQIVVDTSGEPKLDDRGRQVLRVKKHDIEEFQDVIDRNGFHTSTLSEIAKAAIADASRPMLALMEGGGDGDGKLSDGDGQADKEVKADAWKRFKVVHLKVRASFRAALEEADFRTLGKLSKQMAKYGEWWAREILGIGDVAKEAIEEAFVKFWAEHPEFCQSQPEEAVAG